MLQVNILNMGGVFNWEYFDSPPNANNPALWALMMDDVLNNK